MKLTIQKHPDAFQPLTDEEFEAVCDAASRVTLYLGRGWSAKPDPFFAVQLVRFWGRTGIHPSKLSTLTPANLRDDTLTWIRTKGAQMGSARVEIPVHREMLPWINDFLRKPKPGRRQLHRMLQRISRQVEEDEGVMIHLNGMRFRHFCARSLLDLGMDPAAVCKMLRISLVTLQYHYGDLSAEAIKERARAMGW